MKKCGVCKGVKNDFRNNIVNRVCNFNFIDWAVNMDFHRISSFFNPLFVDIKKNTEN